jgi:hypothetical protein
MDDEVDFGLIEVKRITFYRMLTSANAYIQYAPGEELDKVVKAIKIAGDVLVDLERDYDRDLANMRRLLNNVAAGRGIDDNG